MERLTQPFFVTIEAAFSRKAAQIRRRGSQAPSSIAFLDKRVAARVLRRPSRVDAENGGHPNWSRFIPPPSAPPSRPAERPLRRVTRAHRQSSSPSARWSPIGGSKQRAPSPPCGRRR